MLMVGVVLSVSVELVLHVESLVAALISCLSLHDALPISSVPAAGVWLMCTGAEPLQSLATRPLVVKSGTGAWQTPSGKAEQTAEHESPFEGVFSLMLEMAVQVDSVVAASMTCKVTVVTH